MCRSVPSPSTEPSGPDSESPDPSAGGTGQAGGVFTTRYVQRVRFDFEDLHRRPHSTTMRFSASVYTLGETVRLVYDPGAPENVDVRFLQWMVLVRSDVSRINGNGFVDVHSRGRTGPPRASPAGSNAAATREAGGASLVVRGPEGAA